MTRNWRRSSGFALAGTWPTGWRPSVVSPPTDEATPRPSVYSLCMARRNISLPDDLDEQARRARLNVSALAQRAVAAELDRRERMARLDAWLDELDAEHGEPSAKAITKDAGVGHVRAPSSACRPAPDAEAHRREGSRLIVVLDTGGVDGLTPIDTKQRARLRALREPADDIVVPRCSPRGCSPVTSDTTITFASSSHWLT